MLKGRRRGIVSMAVGTIVCCAFAAPYCWGQPAAYELAWSALSSGGGSGAAGDLAVEASVGSLSSPAAGVGDYSFTTGFWAIVATPRCFFDVDQDGNATVGTDVVYMARSLLGLTPVPPSFRAQDPRIPGDAAIASEVEAAGAEMDVDQDGSVRVASDLVYIARHLLGLTPVPPSFRIVPGIPPDANIASKIDAACPSQ